MIYLLTLTEVHQTSPSRLEEWFIRATVTPTQVNHNNIYQSLPKLTKHKAKIWLKPQSIQVWSNVLNPK